jgi:nucleoside-diphosphate-sugar epimerase
MRVLLTGANGYLGRHVLRALQSRGIETIATSRTGQGGNSEVPCIAADLLDNVAREALLEQAQATHLIHLAWYVEHGKYWSSPLNFAWAQASVGLVEAFHRHGGRRVVAAGTCAEYDWSYGYLREGITPYHPSTPYGVAKSATRQMLHSLCELHGIEFAWAHIFFPFGLDEAPQRLIPSLFRVFRGELEPFGVNAHSYRGMLPVVDVANAFVSLLDTPSQGAFNVCSGQPTCVADLVRSVANICNGDPLRVLQLASERPGDPGMLVGDNARLRTTGWTQSTTIDQCLRSTYLPAQP